MVTGSSLKLNTAALLKKKWAMSNILWILGCYFIPGDNITAQVEHRCAHCAGNDWGILVGSLPVLPSKLSQMHNKIDFRFWKPWSFMLLEMLLYLICRMWKRLRISCPHAAYYAPKWHCNSANYPRCSTWVSWQGCLMQVGFSACRWNWINWWKLQKIIILIYRFGSRG